MLKTIWGKSYTLILLIMVAFLLPHKAMAQAVDNAGYRLEATMGNQDANKIYRETCDVNGLCISAPDTAYAWGYENIASVSPIGNVAGNPGTGYQLSYSDSGRTIADYGGKTAGSAAIATMVGYGTRYILPTCNQSALGFTYSITTGVTETITITPYSTADSIAFSISGTGLKAGQGFKNSGNAGDNVTVSCNAIGNWVVNAAYSSSGTFATST